MDVNLSSLKTFLKVARHRGITRALGELHLTQPAVSRQIQGRDACEQLASRQYLWDEVKVASRQENRFRRLCGHPLFQESRGPLRQDRMDCLLVGRS